MFFGGIQKNSLIDFPGKISCVLFVSGCNFECPYCHNPDLVRGNLSPTSGLDENSVCDFLEMRKGLLDGVVISGGEPTLQGGLLPFCEKLKEMGYPVKLDTNGTRPQVIGKLIDEGLVDYIAMDIKTDPFHYSPVITKRYSPADILESIRIIMESMETYEFRTTCVKPIVDVNVIGKIGRVIEGAMLYALQDFQKTRLLRPEFFEEKGSGYDTNGLQRLKSAAEQWVNKCIIR